MTVPCAHCGEPVIVDGLPEGKKVWCHAGCVSAWAAADASRSEGWIPLAELTLEQQRDLFERSGLTLAGVGPRKPS
jgi:hypothetical protein